MKLEIRRATPQDLEPMLEWRGGGEAMKTAIAAEFAAQSLGERTILIAFDPQGQQIGTVQLIQNHHDQDLSNAHSVYLQALDVRDAYRGHGVGTALIRALESRAKLIGFSKVTLMVDLDNAPRWRFTKNSDIKSSSKRSTFGTGKRTPWTVLKSISRATPANRLEQRVSGAGQAARANPRQRR